MSYGYAAADLVKAIAADNRQQAATRREAKAVTADQDQRNQGTGRTILTGLRRLMEGL